MRVSRTAVIFVAVLLLIISLSCASTHKKDIEAVLVSAFNKGCKTVEMKFHGDRDIFTISPTGKISSNGCPTAIIKGWREGRLIEKKEVEVCECGEK
jgi:hypothetical protein